jgi:hypothetical protein
MKKKNFDLVNDVESKNTENINNKDVTQLKSRLEMSKMLFKKKILKVIQDKIDEHEHTFYTNYK